MIRFMTTEGHRGGGLESVPGAGTHSRHVASSDLFHPAKVKLTLQLLVNSGSRPADPRAVVFTRARSLLGHTQISAQCFRAASGCVIALESNSLHLPTKVEGSTVNPAAFPSSQQPSASQLPCLCTYRLRPAASAD